MLKLLPPLHLPLQQPAVGPCMSPFVAMDNGCLRHVPMDEPSFVTPVVHGPMACGCGTSLCLGDLTCDQLLAAQCHWLGIHWYLQQLGHRCRCTLLFASTFFFSACPVAFLEANVHTNTKALPAPFCSASVGAGWPFFCACSFNRISGFFADTSELRLASGEPFLLWSATFFRFDSCSALRRSPLCSAPPL